MSPEQARGEEVDAQTDLFSLGVVLHEMAAGTPAFPGNISAVIFEAILNRPPAALDRLHPELARLLTKALEKNCAVRYQTAADLRADLLRLKRDSESGRSAAAVVRPSSRASQARKGIESIAVLPFVTTSGNEDAEYLSEGIAESVINSLSQLGRLRVAQPQKSFRYRGADVDLQQAARELSVQAILTGRLLVRGDTLVVKVNVVDVAKDAQVWGQQFTRTMSDIFVLQEEIAEQVLQALKLQLTGEPKRPVRKQTQNTDVYHLYLKGRHYSAKRTAPNTTRALESAIACMHLLSAGHRPRPDLCGGVCRYRRLLRPSRLHAVRLHEACRRVSPREGSRTRGARPRSLTGRCVCFAWHVRVPLWLGLGGLRTGVSTLFGAGAGVAGRACVVPYVAGIHRSIRGRRPGGVASRRDRPVVGQCGNRSDRTVTKEDACSGSGVRQGQAIGQPRMSQPMGMLDYRGRPLQDGNGFSEFFFRHVDESSGESTTPRRT